MSLTGRRFTKVLFYGVATPVGIAGRPLWQRRLALRNDARATTYWRARGDTIHARDLRGQR